MDSIHFSHPNYFALGYHFTPVRMLDPQKDDSQYSFAVKASNWTNFVGYFPLLGIITGVMRLILLKREGLEETPVLRNLLFARALMEIFCVGWLLIIPDIIATIGRELEIAKGAKWYPGMGSNPPLFDN
jgi:hypothetical protein